MLQKLICCLCLMLVPANTPYASSSSAAVDAFGLDRYGNISWGDEKARLEGFFPAIRINPQIEGYTRYILTIREDGRTTIVLEGTLANALLNAALPCVPNQLPSQPGIQVSGAAKRDSAGRCIITLTSDFADLATFANFVNKKGDNNFQKQGDKITYKIPKGPYDPNPYIRGLFQFIVRMPLIEDYAPREGVKTRISSGDQVLWQYRSEPEIPVLVVQGRLVPAIRQHLVTNRIGMEFVPVPAGTFMMGSEHGNADEKPLHRVTISNTFLIGRTEVTQAQWQAVMANSPSNFKGDDLPVEEVSWLDAQLFIQKLNQMRDGYTYRLPTEAEWEYACRAGMIGDYPANLNLIGWYAANSEKMTHPVGQKEPNAFGLYDIHGNVWEWCQDWYDKTYYQNSPNTDPQGPASGQFRVLRGGSWLNVTALLGFANRGNDVPASRRSAIGFRVVAVR